MFKRNHVLLVSGLIAVASSSFSCCADDDQERVGIRITESQRIEAKVDVIGLSPSGNLLAFSLKDNNQEIIVYEKNTEGEFEQKRSHCLGNFEPYKICFNPNDKKHQLAVLSWKEGGYKVHLLGGSKINLLKLARPECMSYSPNGLQLAIIERGDRVGNKYITRRASIWNTENGQLLRFILLNRKHSVPRAIKLKNIQYHSDGKTLMISGSSNKVYTTLNIADKDTECSSVRIFNRKLTNGLVAGNGNIILRSKKPKEGENFIHLASFYNLLSQKISIPEGPGLNEALDDSGPTYYLYKENEENHFTSVWQLDREKSTAKKVGSVPWSSKLVLSQDGSTLVGKTKSELTVYHVEKQQ